MKKEIRRKKLQLHSETLKRLDSRELTAVVGGGPAPMATTDTECNLSLKCTGGGGGFGN